VSTRRGECADCRLLGLRIRLDESGPQHHYFGQDQAHNETSAFVFGYRQTTTWKFYAQIVKGVMAATGIDALKDATDKVVPLDQAYEIA
jgi:hypothetical protein